MPRSPQEPIFPAWVIVALLLFGLAVMALDVAADAHCRERGGVPLWSRAQLVCPSPGVTR